MSETQTGISIKGAPCAFSHENRTEMISEEESILSCQTMTQATADILLGQVAEIEAEIQENNSSAETQIHRIQMWNEAMTERLLKKSAFYEKQLEDWMRMNGHKTKKLVHGTLKLRKQQPIIEVHDEQKVLSDSRFVRIIPEKVTVDKNALRKHVKSTGELVEGVSVSIPEDKFTFDIYEPVG